MIEVYVKRGLNGWASFEFFVRKLPEKRNFLVAAGLEQVMMYLEGLRFGIEELSYLKEIGFSQDLLDYLAKFSFVGDVWAMPEGTIFFANEPILRVEAPLPQAQLVETRIINILHFQILIASKAIRVTLAARGKPLLDFGLRRSHEASAGLLASRACYIGGFSGTATVEAGRAYGIPVTGTMAHSFVLAHGSEEAAFRSFIDMHPQKAILLIDTFDTLKCARLVTRLYHEYLKKGIRIKGVRIDSGDLFELSRRVRKIFDQEGCNELLIFVSGGLDETKINNLVASGAPIDGFGVGTLVDTSADAPFLDCAYKMVEYERAPRMKYSTGKKTLPYRKQVFRCFDRKGLFESDVITTMDENIPSAKPLLVRVMKRGKRIYQDNLREIRKRTICSQQKLPPGLRDINNRVEYHPEIRGRLNRIFSNQPFSDNCPES